jgi:cytidine deaminase
VAELTRQQIELLLEAAQKATEHAYAPFSRFHVGAAILTEGGEIFTGCNVENSSFGLTNCAERTAIFTAVAAGAVTAGLDLVAVAVVNREGAACPPCGACRQVIFEFGPKAVVIYRANSEKIVTTIAEELLPDGFRRR